MKKASLVILLIMSIALVDASALPATSSSSGALVEPQAQLGTKTVTYTIYDIFKYPLYSWWDVRYASYGTDQPVNHKYGVHLWEVVAGAIYFYINCRLKVEAQNLPEINMADANPKPMFFPLLAPTAATGGTVEIDWYMNEMTQAEVTAYFGWPKNNSNDGWLTRLTGTMKLDLNAAKRVLGWDGSDFATWWAANGGPQSKRGTVTYEWDRWVNNQGNLPEAQGGYDITASYGSGFSSSFFSSTTTPTFVLTASRIGDYITVTIDSPGVWGWDYLFPRWFLHSFMTGHETGVEDMTLKATITPDGTTSLYLDCAEPYLIYAYESELDYTLTPPRPGTKTGTMWEWENALADVYLSKPPVHPDSEMDPWAGVDYMTGGPGNLFSGANQSYDYTPWPWDLQAGESIVFEKPNGIYPGYVHLGPDHYGSELALNVSIIAGPLTTCNLTLPPKAHIPSKTLGGTYSENTTHIVLGGPMNMTHWALTVTSQELQALGFSYPNFADERDRILSEYGKLLWPWGLPSYEFDVLRLGDQDGSGYVGPIDLSYFAAAYGKRLGQTGYRPLADLDINNVKGTENYRYPEPDGYIGPVDLSYFAASYGKYPVTFSPPHV